MEFVDEVRVEERLDDAGAAEHEDVPAGCALDVVDFRFEVVLGDPGVGGEHAAALVNRVEQDRAVLAYLEKQKKQVHAKVAAHKREYGQISDIRQQLQLESAHADVATGAAEERECRKVEEDRKFEARAWEAVPLVIDIGEARARVRTSQEAYDEAERGMAPLRRRADRAASALAARMDALADEAMRNAEEAVERERLAGQEYQRAQDRVTEANRRIDAAQRDIEAYEKTVRTADRDLEEAVSAGWIDDGDSLPATRTRRPHAPPTTSLRSPQWDLLP